jgi:hypothetical protein
MEFTILSAGVSPTNFEFEIIPDLSLEMGICRAKVIKVGSNLPCLRNNNDIDEGKSSTLASLQ